MVDSGIPLVQALDILCEQIEKPVFRNILAKIKVKEIADLNEFLLSKVRRVDGVEKTSTLISAA